MKNIAIGLGGLDGLGTLKHVSFGIWTHAHIKLGKKNIQLGDEPVDPGDDLLGARSECCFFMTGQDATESFYCGQILRIVEAPFDGQMRYRIEFSRLLKTVKSEDIDNFEGLLRGQHHVYY